MFGWFRPQCPVDPVAKQWLEERLEWLACQFGIDVFVRRAVILPNDDFFPDRYDGSEESVRTLLDRVCAYMDVDPNEVDLELFDDPHSLWLVNERGQYLPHAAGLYDAETNRTIIHLESSQIIHPMALVGTMAHEIAHHRLLGDARIDADAFDGELLTDLTAVYHGFGIFLANFPAAWESGFTTWPETDVRKSEYMTLPMLGHTLAHTAWLREDRSPKWSRHLRLDARACFHQGLRYLWETGDSRFKLHDSL